MRTGQQRLRCFLLFCNLRITASSGGTCHALKCNYRRFTSRSMRIAFVAQPFDLMYPPVPARSTSSLALWIYYMARGCANRGHRVIGFGSHGGRCSAKSTRSENVAYIFTTTGLDRTLDKTLKAG